MRPWPVFVAALAVIGCGSARDAHHQGNNLPGKGVVDADMVFRTAYPNPTNPPDGYGPQRVVVLTGQAQLYHMHLKDPDRYRITPEGLLVEIDRFGRATEVEAHPWGVTIDERAAVRYRPFQGYDGRMDGKTLRDVLVQLM